MDRDSNEKQELKSSWQQRDRRLDVSIALHSKSDANAGTRTSLRTLTRMGCSMYANQFSDIQSCVLDRVVIFAIRKNYLANYVQKLR